MKKLIIIALLFASCDDRQPQKDVETSNNDYQIQLLFEIDGCKVYRFFDRGSTRYFTNCKGNVTWETSNGKSTQQHSIETQ